MGWLNPKPPTTARPATAPEPSRRERRAAQQNHTRHTITSEGRTITVAVPNDSSTNDLADELQHRAQHVLGRTVTHTEARRWAQTL